MGNTIRRIKYKVSESYDAIIGYVDKNGAEVGNVTASCD